METPKEILLERGKFIDTAEGERYRAYIFKGKMYLINESGDILGSQDEFTDDLKGDEEYLNIDKIYDTEGYYKNDDRNLLTEKLILIWERI